MLTDKQITQAYAGAFPDRSPGPAPVVEATVVGIGGMALAEQSVQPAESVALHVPPAVIGIPELV